MTTRRKVRSEASGPDDLLIESFYLLTLQTDTEFKPIPRQPVHMKLRLEQEDSDTILPQASARGKFSDWPSDMCYNIHAQSDSIMVCLPTPKTRQRRENDTTGAFLRRNHRTLSRTMHAC